MPRLIFRTANSVWTIDPDALIYTRVPQLESPDHDQLSYEECGKPAPFHFAHLVEERGGQKMCIHVDEPNPNYPDIHRRITTGDLHPSQIPDEVFVGNFERCPNFLEEDPTI